MPRSVPRWLIVAGAAIVLLIAARAFLGLYVEWLWFREVQFTSVFLTVLRTEIFLGLITATGYFLILYGNVLLARRLSPPSVRVATSIDTSSTASTGR